MVEVLVWVPIWLLVIWLLAESGEFWRDLWYLCLFIALYVYLDHRFHLDWQGSAAVIAISVLGIWEGRGCGR